MRAQPRTSLRSLVVLATVAALPACDSPSEPVEQDPLDAIREATAQFSSTATALAAGYEPDDHCVAHPELGGMGYHWLNPGLLDDTFEPNRPEVLLYGPAAGGELELIGVEYIVMDVGQDRPSLDGHPFDVGGTPVPAPHWSLHVWLYAENPAGVFTPFNPNISCP